MSDSDLRDIGKYVNALVCELEPGEFVDGFAWYELNLDDDRHKDVSLPRGEHRFIGASMDKDTEDILRRLDQAESLGLDYLLFEAAHDDDAKLIVVEARERGIATVVAHHRMTPIGNVDEVVSELSVLADSGADIVKLVYPANTGLEVGFGLEGMGRVQAVLDRPVSLTPDGTWWGRVSAGMAGSSLVFASTQPSSWRPTVAQFISLYEQLTPPPADTPPGPLNFGSSSQ